MPQSSAPAAAALASSSWSQPAALNLISWALLLALSLPSVSAHASFHSIYAFGDSLTDTGNSLIYQRSINVGAPEGHLPYGRTFFHYPTGRLSDGRVVIDFLADNVKAPHFLLPFLGLNGTDTSLVTFAVGGATAQNVDYLNSTYNISVFTPYSINRQIQWFSSLPISKDKGSLSEALVYIAEIGVNDYNYALTSNISIDEVVEEFVPNVMAIIKTTLEYLIASGAKHIVVEGGYPIGCTPVYTRLYFVNAATDKYGCVIELHKLSQAHNRLLKKLVRRVSLKYSPDIHIIFFDRLRAHLEILKHPSRYGFSNTTDPCFDILHSANLSTVEACPNSGKYTNWDGVHFTEAVHKVLINLFYMKGFVKPYPNFLTAV